MSCLAFIVASLAPQAQIVLNTTLVKAEATKEGARVTFSPIVGGSALKPALTSTLEGRVRSIQSKGGTLTIKGVQKGRTWVRKYSVDQSSGQLQVSSSAEFYASKPRASEFADSFVTSQKNGRFEILEKGQTVTVDPGAVLLVTENKLPIRVVRYRGQTHLGIISWKPNSKNNAYDPVLRTMPKRVGFTYQVSLGAQALENSQVQSWNLFGKAKLLDPSPQPMPFLFMTEFVYSFGESEEEERAASKEEEEHEKEEGPWWSEEMGGMDVGGPREPGTIGFSDHALSMRAAWGMKWWGEQVGHPEWKERAEQLFNLMLVAPYQDLQGIPYEFNVKTEEWSRPGGLAGTAANAYWAVRWLEKWSDGEAPEKARGFTAKVLADCSAVQESAIAASEKRKGRGQTGMVSQDAFLGAAELRFVRRCANSKAIGEESARSAQRTWQRYNEWLNSLDAASRDLIRSKNRSHPTSYAELTTEERAEPDLLIQSLTHSPDSLEDDALCLCEMGRVAVNFMRAGALTGRQDIFERGLVRLRSQFKLLSDPTLVAVGLRGPNFQFGRAATLVDGYGDFGQWLGFEHGEGQILASVAETLDEFGGFFVHPSGWSVGIDGVTVGTDNGPVSLLIKNPKPFSGRHEVEVVKEGTRTKVLVSNEPVINRIGVRADKGTLKVIAVPAGGDRSIGHSGVFFATGSSWSKVAETGATGFEASIPRSVLGKGKIGFRGVYSGQSVDKEPETLRISPDGDWTRLGGLEECLAPSLAGLSTADDGTGKSKPSLKGRMLSSPFWATSGRLEFSLSGRGVGCDVKLVDLLEGNVLEEVVVGKRTQGVRWNLAKYNGHKVRLEITDRDDRGWARVSNLRLSR